MKSFLGVLAELLLVFILGLGAGYFLHAQQDPVYPEKITRQDVKADKINTDVSSMTLQAIQSELRCFYAGDPGLDIEGGGPEYLLTASLCSRSWERRISIRSPCNYFSGGVAFIFADRYQTGLWFDYQRFVFGNISVGGGVTVSLSSFEARLGAGYRR